MTNDKLKKAMALKKELDKLDKAMVQLDSWTNESDPNNYNLTVVEHSDGSGHRVNLDGLEELCHRIKIEIATIVSVYHSNKKKEFDEL